MMCRGDERLEDVDISCVVLCFEACANNGFGDVEDCGWEMMIC